MGNILEIFKVIVGASLLSALFGFMMFMGMCAGAISTVNIISSMLCCN